MNNPNVRRNIVRENYVSKRRFMSDSFPFHTMAKLTDIERFPRVKAKRRYPNCLFYQNYRGQP